MYLSREFTGSTLVKIGLHFGKRDHSTVIHACSIVEKKLKSNIAFKNKMVNSFLILKTLNKKGKNV